jgi:hypothetical protein
MKQDVSKFEVAFNIIIGIIATISGFTLINLMFIEFGCYKSILAICTYIVPMNIALIVPILLGFKMYIEEVFA